MIALDVAASEFYKDGKYQMEGEGLVKTSNQMVDYLAALCAKYPIVSIEDGLAEDDWKGWKALTKNWETKCSWWATTCSLLTSSACLKASKRYRQRYFDQSQSDRYFDRDLQCYRNCETRRLYLHHFAPQR